MRAIYQFWSTTNSSTGQYQTKSESRVLSGSFGSMAFFDIVAKV